MFPSPRALLIERYGQLVGLITVKDCLKYTLAHEASSARGDGGGGRRHGSSSVVGTAGMAEDELEQTLEDLRAWILDVKAAVKRFVLGREVAGTRLGTEDFDDGGEGETEAEDEDEDERGEGGISRGGSFDEVVGNGRRYGRSG